jgi:serpin B
MRQRTRFVASAPLLFALAACGGSASSTPSPNPANPANPATPPVPIAKSTLARDAAGSIAPASLAAAVIANNAFALDLYGRLAATSPTSNTLTSPISASLALTMTYAGAKGDTATQMATALHFGSATSDAIFDGQNALTQALASRAAAALAADTQTASNGEATAPSPDDYQVQVVNSVWGEKTYAWASPFLDTLAKSYGTGVYQEDFVTQFDQARQTINTWVSTETADKIQNLLPTGALDDLTRMVLVNAIHLKLPWASTFDVSATQPAAFTKGDGTSASTPFMNQTTSFAYTDDGKAQIVSLPLSGGKLSVVIALPHGDLATYEAGLTATSAGIAQPSSGALVALALPKVSFTSPTFSLKTPLAAMGMVAPFDDETADFTGMCASPPDGGRLYIEDVLQKAMIAMQETGVEAAAATAVIVGTTLGASGTPPTPIPMIVNRPFLLSIIDVPTGAVLFVGHIEDPTSN